MGRPSDHLLRTLAAVPPGCRVLDVGCGDGTHAEALRRLGFDVWACDADPRHVAAARERLGAADPDLDAAARVTAARPAALGYPDDHFDWAVAYGTLDDADDAERAEALCEIRRVLAPGAWVFVASEALGEAALVRLAEAADLALAERPAPEPGGGVRGIFRKVGDGTAA